MILTIDEGLRDIFLRHHDLLKVFMDEGVRLIQTYFENKHHVTPGIIAGLHTFESRLNFNTHIHMLVTMGGMKAYWEWKKYDYIPFEMLRKQRQTVVLKLIRRHLSAAEKKKVQPLLRKAYAENGDGFYVYAPKQAGDIKAQMGYIDRYMRRPAIAIGSRSMLQIKNAACRTSRAYIERMVHDLAGVKETKDRKEKEAPFNAV